MARIFMSITFCYAGTMMQSVWLGGGSPTYVNARLCGRMVVVTTYKMQRFMQIMTFCLFALHNSQRGGAGGNCQMFLIRSSETSPVKLREISIAIVNAEDLRRLST